MFFYLFLTCHKSWSLAALTPIQFASAPWTQLDNVSSLNSHYIQNKRTRSISAYADIDLVLLLIPLIQSVITFLANSVEIFPLIIKISFYPMFVTIFKSSLCINLTLISECKGMKIFASMQEKLFHKVYDLYHATFFTFAQ